MKARLIPVETTRTNHNKYQRGWIGSGQDGHIDLVRSGALLQTLMVTTFLMTEEVRIKKYKKGSFKIGLIFSKHRGLKEMQHKNTAAIIGG